MIIEMDLYADIRRRHLNGESDRFISKSLGISRQTVKKYSEGEHHPNARKPYVRKPSVLTDELNNFILTVENPETGELELRSFPNEAVKYYFDSSDVLHAYFEEWVGYWKDSKK